MVSKDKEKINFVASVDSKEKSVEAWCKEVEDQIFETLQNLINNSIDEYYKSDRDKISWVRKSFSQCVLTGSKVFYTSDAETAINFNGLDRYYVKLNEQIMDLVDLIRQKLDTLEKKTISPLIVQSVHERDSMKKFMELKINNINEFEWISQLRF